MADTTQNQTAAAGSTPGHKPAGNANNTPPANRGRGERTPSSELDLDRELDAELGEDGTSEIDPELDADLPKPRSNKGKQASGEPKPKPNQKVAKPEDADNEALDSALDEEIAGEEDEEEERAEEGEEETQGEGPTDEELEAAMPENSDDIDPEKPPKGLEGVPKPVWKRIKAQSANIRDLKAQLGEGAIVLNPSPLNPLANVAGLDELDERVAQAREDRKWARDNPEGGSRKVNGKTTELSAEDTAKILADAEAVIDADATTRTRLLFREQSKPWEKAAKVAPDLFVKGTADNAFVLNLVQTCPEITTHPEWEYFAACAARGMRQVVEEREGKARYVRFEVGPDGKLLPLRVKPKAGSGTEKAGGQTPKPKPQTPPNAPASARPPITRNPRLTGDKPAARLAASDSDLSGMLATELGE